MFQQFVQNSFVSFFLVSTILGLSFSANAQICQPTADGLVSWYRAEGNALDASGGNHGGLRSGTTFVPGKSGQGFKFDGADDYIEIPDAASLKPQNITVEAWVRFDNLSSTTSGSAPNGFQYIVHKKNNRQSDHFEGYSLLKLSNHQLAFSIKNDAGAQTTIIDQTQFVQVGRFYHVAGTFDGSTARLYVDGRKVAETPHNSPLSYDARPVFIGSSGEANWDGKMNGVIDEVRIYNRALSASEIAANRLSGALLVNCDAEGDPAAAGDGATDKDVTGWENEIGQFTVVRYAATGGSFPSVSDPGPLNRGAFFFAGGQTATSSASQIISLADYAARIDAGNQQFRLSGFLGGFSNNQDDASLTATFRDANGNAMPGPAMIGPVSRAARNGQTALLYREAMGTIPAGARAVELVLLFTRVDGTYNDGYADNLSFALIEPAAVPDDLAAWHAGDGDARDFLNANNGTLVNNPEFIVGKVGQAFRFGRGSHVRINSDGIFRGRGEGTIEAWIRPSELPTGQFEASAIWVESESSRNFTRLGLYYLESGQVGLYANVSQISALSPAAVPQNQWTHVAGTYKLGEPAKLYVNGALVGQSSSPGVTLSDDPGAFIGVGALQSAQGDDFDFNGDIDETSVYTRALSAGEIRSIYNAGTAGKRRAVATAAAVDTSVRLRDATVTFAGATTAGETVQTPLETSLLPVLPAGYRHTGLAYDIATSVGFSGNVNLCFNLPALAGANFSKLRILHLENGAWVDRTTSLNAPQLCGRAPNLSPFVIAEGLAPTAGSVTVGGRVLAGVGGVYGAQITLTGADGATRYARTNMFGYYYFTNVPSGATYVLTAQHKRYVFEPSSKVLTVADELRDVDFTTAEESRSSSFRK
ncbi:MAG TPA: LamG-like jellyroll fold domain-containing protein [Pyrinomonadaceae bacterium]